MTARRPLGFATLIATACLYLGLMASPGNESRAQDEVPIPIDILDFRGKLTGDAYISRGLRNFFPLASRNLVMDVRFDASTPFGPSQIHAKATLDKFILKQEVVTETCGLDDRFDWVAFANSGSFVETWPLLVRPLGPILAGQIADGYVCGTFDGKRIDVFVEGPLTGGASLFRPARGDWNFAGTGATADGGSFFSYDAGVHLTGDWEVDFTIP